MLDAMRRNSRHAIIYILFGILIAAFIISFGPGSRGFGYSGPSSEYAVKVAGSTVSEQEFHFAYVALGGTMYPPQVARDRRLKEFVMDKLIERELFAAEAARLGYQVSAKEVEDNIVAGKMIVMGVPRRLDSYVYKDGKFDYDRFKLVAQNQLGVTVKHFVAIEQRELLADKLREVLRASTKASPEAVKREFEQRGLQVDLEYARFTDRRHFDEVAEATATEVDTYVKAHEAELKKLYEERSFLYKKLDRQAKLRHVVVEALKQASAAETQAAKAKADGALAKLTAGTSFAEVARSLSSDERTRGRGGELGWRKKGMTGFGDAVDAKVFAAKPGTRLGPERTDRGFEIIEVEAFREGDVPFAEAARELAGEELRKQKAGLAAKADAQALVDRVRRGESLDKILPKEEPNPSETPEERQMKAFMRSPSDPVKLQSTGLFARRGDIVQDIGVSKELAKRAFELKVGEVAGPFEVGGAWAVVRAKEHRDPDLVDFEKRKPELARDYERSKWAELVDGWAKQRCLEVRDGGKIKVNPDALEYEVGGKNTSKYEPCTTRSLF